MRRLVVAAVLLATLPAAARAQFSVAQTFTAPSTPHPILRAVTAGPTAFEGVDVGGGTYVIDLLAFDGTLVGPSLFSQVLGPAFQGFTLAPNRALVPGATYALSVSGGSMAYSILLGTGVPDGRLLTCFSPSDCRPLVGEQDVSGITLRFAPAVVPEPATWALVGAGVTTLAAVAGVARRRRTA